MMFYPGPQPLLYDCVGVDLGQSRDHTAIVVVEKTRTATSNRSPVDYSYEMVTRHEVRFVELMPLGSRYTDIADRLCDIVRHPDLQSHCNLIVDATGLGAPVVDFLRRKALGRCRLIPVCITSGESESHDGSCYRVPKKDLIASVLMLLQTGNLRIASRLPHAQHLIKELVSVHAKYTRHGHEQFEGPQDDLVMALSLATWFARKIS